ncbi:sigma-70 non-essential region-containing protein, partial [Buchnera aphidicola]|nr:sigma-70 non-essential region-containing protein [Buchnera aphidicola]
VTGFVDPNAEEFFSTSHINIDTDILNKENDVEDEENKENEDDHTIDPELADQKFSELRCQYNNTSQTIKNKNRNHKDSLLEIYHLSEIFKQFRLVPKQFDYLVNNMRSMMEKIRIQERHI